MSLSFDLFATLLLLSPFGAALLAPLISQETGRAAGSILAIVPAGLFVALASLVPEIAAGRPAFIGIDWVPALGLRFAFLVDGLSAVFGLMICGIGTFIVLYSARYLEGHPHRGRFMAFMLLFMGAMLGLVLSDSLVGLIVFWELTSITSFLLIGFDHQREQARRAAIQSIVVTGLGGLALIAGGVLLHYATGTWTISDLAGAPIAEAAKPLYPVTLAFILLAAFTKSAQWPFHFWLPNAMAAPTPVSAYLHSATMVQAGVFLLARLSPALGGTVLWQVALCTVGAITLVWGAAVALSHTDLKQVLAHTTLASLGLSVLLLGIGGESAAVAVAAMFIAHALYKAAMFLVAGTIEHGTGTRDLTQLGGLRDALTISFICMAVAAFSMFGLPPLLGFLAKEGTYAALTFGDPTSIVLAAAIVVGNAALGGVALIVLLVPFMGTLKPTPQAPHEGAFSLWIGPALFGLAGLGALFVLPAYGELLVMPMASAIAGLPLETSLSLVPHFNEPAIWLSVLSWIGAALIYWQRDRVRSGVSKTLSRGWTWDHGFDTAMFGLVRFAGAVTRTLYHGRLELYLFMVVAAIALSLIVPVLLLDGWPSNFAFALLAPSPIEYATIALASAGIAMVLFARTRLFAILALGVQGLAVTFIFLFFGAPDLALTQFMVETLSVVILAMVMTRLNLSVHDWRVFEDWLRDGGMALVAGATICIVLMRVVQGEFDSRLSDFFSESSLAVAHGRNVVNVILVDYRGLDTLGEITVVMTAGIAVLALLRRQHRREADKPARRSRNEAAA